MGRKSASDPPSAACLTCEAWRGARWWRRWAPVLIGAALAALVPIGATAATACARSAVAEERVRTQGEAAQAASDERQRLAAQQAEATKLAAERWGRVEGTLQSIDRRLGRLEDRRDR